MANHVRYIQRRRNGVYHYERRAPKAVLDRPSVWQASFAGRTLFRKSLRTKRQADALVAGQQVHGEFERLLSAALGTSLPASPGDNATTPVTPGLLSKITVTTRERVVRPWASQFVRAELGDADREELDRMVEAREWDAEDLRSVLLERNASADPRMPDISAEVARLVEEERLDALPGSTARAIVSSAVRERHIRGQREIDEILAGTTSAIPTERLAKRGPKSPKISDVMAAYVGQLGAKRTIREANGAVASFIAVAGDLPLDEITRAEVMEFCRVEGSRTIGGKTNGSVIRPVSPETLKKKISLLRAAINHAIATDLFAGPNSAANLDARRFTKPVPKALMPDKRPFTVHEM